MEDWLPVLFSHGENASFFPLFQGFPPLPPPHYFFHEMTCLKKQAARMYAGSLFHNPFRAELLDSILERLTGKELHNGAGGDFNLLIGARVTPGTRRALDNLEAAKAHQGDGIAGSEALGDGGNHSVQRCFRFYFRLKAALGVDLLDQFSFRHGFTLPRIF